MQKKIKFAAVITVLTLALGSVETQAGGVTVPVVIGGNPKFDACMQVGEVVGLDPRGDGFLSVRSGPGGKPYHEVDRLYNGNSVSICNVGETWYAVVYGGDRLYCKVSYPWPNRKAYNGPCRSGWIHSRYVKVIAG